MSLRVRTVVVVVGTATVEVVSGATELGTDEVVETTSVVVVDSSDVDVSSIVVETPVS